MDITTLEAEKMIFSMLLEGKRDVAYGMAVFAMTGTDDVTADDMISRIKDEAMSRMLDVVAESDDEIVAVDLSDHGPTELDPPHPALITEMMDEDDMGPDDRLQAERDAQDVAAALSEPLGEAIVAAQNASDDELIF